MVFRIINLLGDDSDIALSKAKGINLSRLFRMALKTELDLELYDNSLSQVEKELKLKGEVQKFKQALDNCGIEKKKIQKELDVFLAIQKKNREGEVIDEW